MPAQPPFFRTKLLQCSHSNLSYMIARLSTQFAILGKTELAKRLVSKLNNYDYIHGRRRTLLPLHLLWDMQESWPDGEEERVRESIMTERQGGAEKGSDNEGNEPWADSCDLDSSCTVLMGMCTAVRSRSYCRACLVD
jgi:hypothetical protein